MHVDQRIMTLNEYYGVGAQRRQDICVSALAVLVALVAIGVIIVSALGLAGYLTTQHVAIVNFSFLGAVLIGGLCMPRILVDSGEKAAFIAVGVILFAGFIVANGMALAGKMFDHDTICWLTIGSPICFGALALGGAGIPAFMENMDSIRNHNRRIEEHHAGCRRRDALWQLPARKREITTRLQAINGVTRISGDEARARGVQLQSELDPLKASFIHDYGQPEFDACVKAAILPVPPPPAT